MHLCAGDQWHRRQVQFEQTDVLDNQSVDADAMELADHLLCLRQLVVAQQCVQGHIDPDVIRVGEIDDPLDRRDCVAGRLAGAELRRADVDGIGPAANRGDRDRGVPSGG